MGETEWPGDREGRVLWVRQNGQVIERVGCCG